MSGDGSYATHDEPEVMRREAISQGVPAYKIAMDKFGFDTYDSCTRAKRLRNISSVIIVTQGYHLPRAVFSCREIGIDAIGVNAESDPQQGWTPYAIAREWLSTDKLFMQLALHKVRVLGSITL
jgi:vancomycin permeability regulator SanA